MGEKEKKIKEDKTGTLYWTKKEPRKAMATFLRNQNKMMVNSMNVLDRKASIMIRINTTLISGTVVFFEYVSKIPNGQLIGIVLVSCCFISLILALLAAKPPITRHLKAHKEKIYSKYPNHVNSAFMVGLFGDLTLEEYEAIYNEVVQSQELQIGNQVRTNYVMETQLTKGFKILEFSYNAFIIGFVLTVLIFLTTNLFLQV
jgi:hypothetical protein